jgi:hypothetical protein
MGGIWASCFISPAIHVFDNWLTGLIFLSTQWCDSRFFTGYIISNRTDETRGVTELDKLPANAIAYIKRLEELVGVDISILSTGPERNETIVLNNPFA